MKKYSKDNPFIIKTYTFLRSFFIVSGWTGVSRLSGVVREMIMANIFGASAFTDIYSFAIKLPNFFRRFFAEGALNAVLVPHFSNLMTHDTQENVRKFAHQMFSVLALGLFIFVLIFEIGMPWIIKIIAFGFRDNTFINLRIIYYARLMFPYIWLISMVAFMSGILNSMHHFAWAAAISIIANLSMILALIIGKVCDEKVSRDFIMHLLSFSVLIGGGLQCSILWLDCRKNGIKLQFIRPRLTQEIKKLLKTSLPGMLGASVMQINIFIDIAFASSLPIGSVSYLSFADRLNQLPLSLFGAALGTTLLPSLSHFWSHNNKIEAYKTQNKALIFGLLFTMPAAVGLFVLSEPIVSLLYGHGRFDHFAVIQTMLALKAFVLGLPFYVLTKIFSAIFFANKDTTTPVIIAAICVIINATFNYILKDYFAHVGIAMATALSSCINALLGFIILHQKKLFLLEKHHNFTLIKIIFMSFLMGGIVLLAYQTLSFKGSFILESLNSFIPIFIGIGSYIILGYLFKLHL